MKHRNRTRASALGLIVLGAALACLPRPCIASERPVDPVQCTSREFAALRIGDAVSIDLGAGDVRTGVVRFAGATGGVVRVGARLDGGATVSVSDTDGVRKGRVVSGGDRRAWRIDSTTGDGGRPASVPIDSLLCTDLKRRAPADVTSSSGATGATGVPENPRSPTRALGPVRSGRPSAVAVLFIDFDGAVVIDPLWEGGARIDALASNYTTEQQEELRQRVALKFAPFDIDVTIDESRYTGAPVGRRMRVIVTPTILPSHSNAGGVGLLDSFAQAGTGEFLSDTPCWTFESMSLNFDAEVTAHELGHTLGLAHDGRELPGGEHEEYYNGAGSGRFRWCPIMGNNAEQNLTMWSRGEYRYANNQQDDVALIAGAPNFAGFAPDENDGAIANATAVTVDGPDVSASGTIANEDDQDTFRIDTDGGRLVVDVAGPDLEAGPHLAVELLDGEGRLLKRFSSANRLNVHIRRTLRAGTFYLRVTSRGRGNPARTGYSAYGSIGEYTISGTLQ